MNQAPRDRSGEALLALLLLAAGAFYLLVLQPEAAATAAAETQLATARAQHNRHVIQVSRLRQRKEELENNRPEVLRDAIRETLHKGTPGEKFLRPMRGEGGG